MVNILCNRTGDKRRTEAKKTGGEKGVYILPGSSQILVFILKYQQKNVYMIL